MSGGEAGKLVTSTDTNSRKSRNQAAGQNAAPQK
jgi:hypothetical protein